MTHLLSITYIDRGVLSPPVDVPLSTDGYSPHDIELGEGGTLICKCGWHAMKLHGDRDRQSVREWAADWMRKHWDENRAEIDAAAAAYWEER